jgi:hypothetical protein
LPLPPLAPASLIVAVLPDITFCVDGVGAAIAKGGIIVVDVEVVVEEVEVDVEVDVVEVLVEVDDVDAVVTSTIAFADIIELEGKAASVAMSSKT